MAKHIKLFIRDGGPGAFFSYTTQSGREIIFKREDNIKVARIPVEEWRAQSYGLAIDLLEQNLHPPIIFDFEETGAEPTTVSEPLPDERDSLIEGLQSTIANLQAEVIAKQDQIDILINGQGEEAEIPLTDEELAARLLEHPSDPAEEAAAPTIPEIPEEAPAEPATLPEQPPVDNAPVESGSERSPATEPDPAKPSRRLRAKTPPPADA